MDGLVAGVAAEDTRTAAGRAAAPGPGLRSRGRLRTLVGGLVAATLAGGCAVHRTVVNEGRPFPVERIPAIDAAWRDGMDREAVRGLLGDPHATGIDDDGHPYWLYRQRGVATTSGGGGVLVVGVVASQSSTGGEIRIAFDARGQVRHVAWEIAGPEAWRAQVPGGRR